MLKVISNQFRRRGPIKPKPRHPEEQVETKTLEDAIVEHKKNQKLKDRDQNLIWQSKFQETATGWKIALSK